MKSVAELSEHFMDKKSREEKDWHGITVDEEMMDSSCERNNCCALLLHGQWFLWLLGALSGI